MIMDFWDATEFGLTDILEGAAASIFVVEVCGLVCLAGILNHTIISHDCILQHLVYRPDKTELHVLPHIPCIVLFSLILQLRRYFFKCVCVYQNF